MKLTLTITQAKGGGERLTRTLAKGTLSIGRAAGNDWVLPDPDQHLSRTHCMVAYEGGSYWLTDLSTNGMLINGAREPTTRDSRVVLTDGDTIQLGGYLMRVAEVEDGRSADPFASSASGPLDADPLDDPFAEAAPAGFQHPLAHPPPSLRVEDPFDLGDKGGRKPDPDADLFRGSTPLDAWTGPAQPDRADAISHAVTPPRPIHPLNLDEIDFDALIGDLMPTPPKQASPSPQPAGPAHSLDDLLGDTPPVAPPMAPQVASPLAPPAAPPPATPPPAPPPRAEAPAPKPASAPTPAPSPALLAAFLEGAGLTEADLAGADQAASMRAIGALFRAFVDGTREVLMSRAQIKHEMRVEQTMIRSRDNNALKFSVSTEEAMAALLRPSRPGYKPPLDAVEEAFRDILSHEMAVMAGMQTGMIALLKRFDPAGLESRLQRGMLDGILPGARRARFWDLFCTSYKEIAREAEDDFNAVFGRDFARAYDAQVNKL